MTTNNAAHSNDKNDKKNASASPATAVPAAPTSAAAPSAVATAAPKPSSEEDESDKDPLMYFIVTGPVHSFKSVAKAEKFLNEPGAPSEYTVIRGRAAPASKKVSLRG